MKDRKADFLTAENCNHEVDRLREELSGWKDVVASRDAEVAELREQVALLRDAMQNAVNWANGREDEWGNRAINSFAFLYRALVATEPK